MCDQATHTRRVDDTKHVEIVIAEDSPTQAMRLSGILEGHGYPVEVAPDGREAFTLIQDRKPTMVIADILMPKMDGYDLCRHIKGQEELQHIPVLLLTTLSEPEDIIRGLQCGADHFVLKPYEDDALLARVRSILLNRELHAAHDSEMGIEIFFGGQKHFIRSSRIQMLDLLLSSYDIVVSKNMALIEANRELRNALDTIESLKGLIPICSNCKKIYTDDGYWQQVEEFIQKHSAADFTHTICPRCTKNLYPHLRDLGISKE